MESERTLKKKHATVYNLVQDKNVAADLKFLCGNKYQILEYLPWVRYHALGMTSHRTSSRWQIVGQFLLSLKDN